MVTKACFLRQEQQRRKDRRASCKKFCIQIHHLPPLLTPGSERGTAVPITVPLPSLDWHRQVPQQPHLTWLYGEERTALLRLCAFESSHLLQTAPYGPTQASCRLWEAPPLSLSKPGPGARQALARVPHPPHQACWRQPSEHTALTVW